MPLCYRRFWITNLTVLILFVIIAYQLVQLGVFHRQSLVMLADRQHFLRIEVPPLRGSILDRHGKELATNLKVPSVYAIPRLLGQDEKSLLAKRISEILNLDPAFVLERLKRDKAFVWLKRRVPSEQAEQVHKLRSPALGIIHEYKRFYPQGDLLAQVLGFTNVDSGGLEGVELSMNRELEGRSGYRLTKRDARGREIRAFEVKSLPAVNGHHVILTIDQYLQYLTERALDRAFLQWKAKGASAVVLDPNTGEILAMANRPTFDPNHYDSSLAASRRNRAITDMYEPGSVFKIVTASAALNENKVTPTTRIFCENGAYRYSTSRVLHDVHEYGDLPFADVIVKSSNIGTVKVGLLVGPDLLQHYLDQFGFGRATGIDLPGETSGYTRPVREWSKTSPYNIPIGQEVLVTALQMTTAMAVIANGGKWVRPYLISQVRDEAGIAIRETGPLVKRQVLRPETAAVMREILVRVVEEGTGKKAKIEGIPVGGKTGTAQKVLPHGRGYSHSNFMASFVGFAPADDPKFVMTIVLDDPKPLYYGGTVAAPVFKEVMETALFAMGYAPENLVLLTAVKPSIGQDVQENRPMLQPAQAGGTGF